MPNYEYICNDCGHTFEEFLSVSKRKKPEKEPCPKCEKKKTISQTILSNPGMAIDTNHRVDGDAKGGFRDVMQKIINNPSVKGTQAERYYKNRYGL